MRLTRHSIALMRKQVAKKSIEDGELRRVEGMGNLFMSTSRAAEDEECEFSRLGWTYWFVYSLKIDGIAYFFYGGAPDALPEDTTGADPE